MIRERAATGRSAEATAAYVCALGQAEDVGQVGGKAYTLGRMLGLGLTVPPGFVVTDAAFQAFLGHDALRGRIAALCRDVDPRDPDAVRRASTVVRNLVTAGEIPGPVRNALAETRRRILPQGTLIVRSSAVGEDSEAASFAGQLDSRRDVESADELEHALLTCWASYWSERSLAYQHARQSRLVGMGIVVQEQVRSRLSGVLFTRAPDPRGGRRDDLLVEYCDGDAEALVSGRINPGRVRIARASLRATHHAAFEARSAEAGGCVLEACRIAELAGLGLTLEREFGGAQDIEWTIGEDGQLYVVQSRPITVRAASPDAPDGSGRRGTPGSPLVLWSNANVNENFPEPISPLLYSIASAGYYEYFRGLARAFGISSWRIREMEQPLRHIIGVHAGRMYYNLTSIHAVLQVAPFGDLLTEWFNQFVGASGSAPPPRRVVAWGEGERARRWIELGVIALKTTWQYLFLSRRIAAFERAVSEFSARTRPDALADRSLVELLDELRAFVDIRCHHWTDAALADAASMVCYGTLKRLLNAAFPASDQAALHNTLLKGLPDLVSGVPVLRLWDLSRRIRRDDGLTHLFATHPSPEILARLGADEAFAPFRRDLDDFLEHWGFRCSGELMLTVPSFQENPAGLLDILKMYAAVDGDSPAEVLWREDAARRVETTRVLSVLRRRRLHLFLPVLNRAHLVGLVLRGTHRSIAFRERARLKQALLYSRCRRIALQMGERLVARGSFERREDVFFLTYPELDALVSGSAMFPYHVRRLVALRQQEHAELGAMSPPDTFTLPEGDYLGPPTGSPAAESSGDEAHASIELSGLGACGGRATGRATILGDVSESSRLAAGDVLVTRQTDPGWGPVFFLIAGLVMERGGMLSHGAIIAREFGIPAVVGVREATRRITPGAIVSVDGDRGLVRLTG